LAGRAAEKIGLGEPSEGAGGSHGSDLALATKLIAGLYTTLGLEDTLVHRASREEIGQVLNADVGLRRKVGDVLAELNAEVEAILAGHREALEGLAMALLQRRFLTAHDIAGLLGDLELKTMPGVENQNSDVGDGRRRPL
jgi:ATP-dependent Zn protease